MMKSAGRIIPWLLLGPILLLVLALFLLWLPLPPPFPAPFSGDRNLIAAVLTGLLALGYLLLVATRVIVQVRRASRVYDQLFATLGMKPSSLGIGRHYQGKISDRPVSISYHPPRAIQPALLNITINTAIDHRAAFGRKHPLLDCRDCPQLPVEDPNLVIRTENEHWVERLLAQQDAHTLLDRLLGEKNLGQQVYLQPGKIWFRSRPWSHPGESTVRQWLDDLVSLAHKAEKVTNKE